ncbi:sorting nexin-10 [Callorhinchus milii]|uniref:Sorting nexin 10a n=1 Tax=Callorhinchus milii TaxID=7868 RepID=A0A4W3HCT8_CALMI|nr:sorting nexin-10 [Callorhinchus milii]XP_007898694.1 sorting nexin-10 [Callorhinchus milii]|eukprot:gi/632965037/ref/XP_007898692.1/ PREDICTED: sorting nexin-10 [Callorhinchus milii]
MKHMAQKKRKEFISVWVRDPRIQKEDSWQSYVDYEICIHTNSMCFTIKTSRVRRRYKEFDWLKQRLQDNAILIRLPDLPPKTPFLSISNAQLVEQRRQGLQDFLEKVLQINILLSDSRLHLFLQTQLSPPEIEACVSGLTDYSVAEAIHKHATSNRRFPVEKAEQVEIYLDSDSESTSSSGLGNGRSDNVKL